MLLAWFKDTAFLQSDRFTQPVERKRSNSSFVKACAMILRHIRTYLSRAWAQRRAPCLSAGLTVGGHPAAPHHLRRGLQLTLSCDLTYSFLLPLLLRCLVICQSAFAMLQLPPQVAVECRNAEHPICGEGRSDLSSCRRPLTDDPSLIWESLPARGLHLPRHGTFCPA